MNNKIIKLNRDAESICETANKKCEKGDFIGALSLLLNESENDCVYADVYAHIADIYTELGLYENAVCFWYKYLLKSKKKYYADGYNGLGANYYYIGDKTYAGYYFAEQIKVGGDEPSIYEDVLEDFRDELINNQKPSFKIVTGSDAEDRDRIIVEQVKDLNKKGDYEASIKLFDEIPDDSNLYAEALLERAFSRFCVEDVDGAITDAKLGISKGYETVNSLTFILHLLNLVGSEEYGNYIEILKKLKTETSDDKYKKLTALCEFHLFKESEELADELIEKDSFDVNTLFIKAFLRYNDRDYETAEDFFRNAYILSVSQVALFYMRVARDAQRGNVRYNKLAISFSLPVDEIERRSEIIKRLIKKESSIKDYSFDEMKELFEWVFSLGSQSQQLAVAVIFAKSNDLSYLEVLKQALINPFVLDEVKMRIVSLLCENSSFNEIKVVYSHVFRSLKINRPSFLDEGYNQFFTAYCYAFGRLSVFEKRDLRLLEFGALELQKELISMGNVDKIGDTQSLACAMYFYSGLETFKDREIVYKLFDVNKKEVVKIIKLTEEKVND